MIFTSTYNRCFPVKRVRAKKNVLRQPWLTKGLLKSIQRKNVLTEDIFPRHEQQYRTTV